MAAMWKVIGRSFHPVETSRVMSSSKKGKNSTNKAKCCVLTLNDHANYFISLSYLEKHVISKDVMVLSQLCCRECLNNRIIAASTVHLAKHPQLYNQRCGQVRHMSDGRKGFFQSIYDNVVEGMTKDKELNENLKKFREEKEKLEKSEAIQRARQKFESIESETSKGSEVFRKGYEDVKEKVSETLDEVQKAEFVKKSMEVTGEIGKTVSKAGETIYEQGQKISQSTPVQTVAEGVKAVKQEFDDVALSKARPYRAPEKLRMRSEKLSESERDTKIYEADNETLGVVLHKDSKWFQSWQDFKDNNQYVNKVFDLKMKYDESDNVVVRASRVFTDKLTHVFGGMFSTTEMSDVLTEIVKMDPNFELDRFLRWCQYVVIPNILEAMVRGDEEVLKDWCYEAPYSVLSHPIKTAKAAGLKFDNKILDVASVDVAAGKMMEQGPVLVISFNSQQIMAVRNSKGDVVEGDPDKIMRVMYVWALCRDQEELDPEAAWKLLDISANAQEQWL